MWWKDSSRKRGSPGRRPKPSKRGSPVSGVRGTSGEDELRARQAVQHSDNERTGFYRFLFHTNWDAPNLYDLIINTHVISAKTATALVLNALSAKEVSGRKR